MSLLADDDTRAYWDRRVKDAEDSYDRAMAKWRRTERLVDAIRRDAAKRRMYEVRGQAAYVLAGGAD